MSYQQCKRCVMDTTAANIIFDEEGICNYCTDYLRSIEQTHEISPAGLPSFIEKIKKDGKNKPYDCIVGVSGGVDSSYVLHLALQHGLRPLAVHMDNGWNSELAVNNIKNIVEKLNLDLYTHVIDWNEYKQLMQAFFNADVIDIELLYDNAMLAVNYQLASKYGIKYILSGSNHATEGMKMPINWNWYKKDKKNIISLAKKNHVKINTFPIIGTLEYIYFRMIKKIEWVPFLDYTHYEKEKAIQELTENYNFKKYPYKHYESVFTRFYQGYILPNKFGVDKRKVHFSTLICSGQMTREEALSALATIPYPSENDLKLDIEYFLKKMSWTSQTLQLYLRRKEVPHTAYGSEKAFFNKLKNIYLKFVS